MPARRDRDLRDLFEQIDLDPNGPSAPPKNPTRAKRRKRKARADALGVNPRQPSATSTPTGTTVPTSITRGERRAIALSLERGRQAADLVLAEPCPDHRADSGEPCWRIFAGESASRAGLTCCAVRTRTAIARHRKPARERAAA